MSCQKGDRRSQDKLYKEFYGYGLGICLRYSRTNEEAVEILNDGFIKIFSNLDKYTKGLSFKGWFRRIMINSAIDHYRRNEKHYNSLDISYAHSEQDTVNALDVISEKELISAIQQLPPSYRMVFNLFVIEGYSHVEISNKLNISVGTSKSNLSIARSKLQKVVLESYNHSKPKEGHGRG